MNARKSLIIIRYIISIIIFDGTCQFRQRHIQFPFSDRFQIDQITSINAINKLLIIIQLEPKMSIKM